MNYSANPDAMENYRNGEATFAAGIRDREAVLRAHLQWDRGTAAEYHFAEGYREATLAAGLTHADASESLALTHSYGALSLADEIRICEIRCEEQVKRYGRAPAQWRLDQLRAKLG
jgi:hypothetical protein